VKDDIAGNNMITLYSVACLSGVPDCMKQFGSPYSPGVEPAVTDQTFGLEAQTNVVCDKTRLMTVLLERQHHAPLLVG